MIKVKVDNRATPRLIRIAAGLNDTKAANRRISIALYGWVIRNFDSGGMLQRPAWKPLAPSTAAQKAKLGYSSKPLMRTGNLRGSFSSYYDERVAGVGARASYFKRGKKTFDYATVHEYGSKRVPARPMLPTERYATDVALAVYKNFISAATNPGNVAKAIGSGLT